VPGPDARDYGLLVNSARPSSALLPDDIQLSGDVIERLKPLTDGDTTHEELTCIGLNPNTPSAMNGVVLVKKACGYSGIPCSDGSRE
jgi:hypothetical protein